MHFTETSPDFLPSSSLTSMPSVLKQLQCATQEMISLIKRETNMSKCMPDVFMDDKQIWHHLTDEMHNMCPYLVLKHRKVCENEQR